MRNRAQHFTALICQIGAWSAIIAALLFRRNMDAEYYLFHDFGIFNGSISSAPQTAADWIYLMQTRPVLGLTLMNAFDLINIALVGFMFIAVIIVLWNKNPYFMGFTALLTVFAVVYFFITNQAVAFYQLSQELVQMNTGQQALYFDQAQSLLQLHFSNHYSPNSIYPSYLMITLSGLFLGIQMFTSGVFTKLCARMGIIANGIALTYWGFHFLLPNWEFIAPAGSAIFLLIWYMLIGLQLLKHAKSLSMVNNQA